MIFPSRDGASGIVKKVANSLSKSKKKNENNPSPRNFRRSISTGSVYEPTEVQAKKIGLIRGSRKQAEQKDGDADKRYGPRKSFDGCESVFLSSKCTSPSFLQEERRLSVSFHFSVDERVVSWLSNLAHSSLAVDTGAPSLHGQQKSTWNKETSSVEKTIQSAKIVLQRAPIKKSTTLSPLTSHGDGNAELSIDSSGSIIMSHGQQSEDSKSYHSSLTPRSASFSSSSHTAKGSKVTPTQSSMKLQKGNPKEVSFVKPEFDESRSTSMVVSYDSSTRTASLVNEDELALAPPAKQAPETKGLKSSNTEEPLFWPFDQKFDWTPEDILKHFIMSPRKKQSANAKPPAGISPRSNKLLHSRKMDSKDGCRRKLIFNSESKIPELKRTSSSTSTSRFNLSKSINSGKNESVNKSNVKRINSMPSRLRRSNKMSMKVVPIESDDDSVKIEKFKALLAKCDRRSKSLVEENFASIEALVGLGEFQGREGLDSDFNVDVFSLDENLQATDETV